MRAVSPRAAEGWLLVCCYYKCNRKLFGSRQLVKSVNNSSWSPRKCDQCERHQLFATSPSQALRRPADGQQDGVLCRPMAPGRVRLAGNAVDRSEFLYVSPSEPASETKKGQRTPSISGARGQRAAPDRSGSALATPVARNATNERSPGSRFGEQPPATAEHTPSTRARASSASRRALGPRQRPSGGQPSCIPEVSAGTWTQVCLDFGQETTPALAVPSRTPVLNPSRRRRSKPTDGLL